MFDQAFRSEMPFGGGLETEASAPVGEAGWSQKWELFLLGQAFWSEIGSPLWPVVQVLGPAHELHVCLQRCLLSRAFVGKPIREGP